MSKELVAIKNKVQKLLALSESCEVHEAAAALEKAEKLIRDYNLTMLNCDEEDDVVEVFDINTYDQREMLFKARVAEYCFCRALFIGINRRCKLVGSSSNTEIALLLINKLRSWVRVKSNIYAPRGYERNSYRRGLFTSIVHLLREEVERRKKEEASTALVVLDNQITDYLEENYGKIGDIRKRKLTVCGDSYRRGIEDGKAAPIFDNIEETR